MARPRRVPAIRTLPPTIAQRAEALALAGALADTLALRGHLEVAHVRRSVASVNVSSPAPGANAEYDVGGEAIMRPLAILCTLTTVGGVANRSVFVEYRDATGVAFLVAGSSATVAPGTSQRFSFWPGAGYPTWPVNDAAVSSLPDQPLDSWETLAVCIDGAQAGDQLSAIRLRGEFEWTTAPDDSAAS